MTFSVTLQDSNQAIVDGVLYTFELNAHRDVVAISSPLGVAGAVQIEYSAHWTKVARAIESHLPA